MDKPTLATGSRGKTVEELQKLLKVLSLYRGKVDGIFGINTEHALRHFQQRQYVTGIADQATWDALESEADRLMVGTQVEPPNGLDAIQELFGAIEYDEAEGGNVVITNDWAKDNIVTASFPVVGKQRVHKLMVPIFQAVFTEIQLKGLEDEIHQFGCWSPRHKMHNPKRKLSTHSWAIACDINWATNMSGREGDMPEAIVEVFERHGFNWGGRWKHRDDMHFQFAIGY